jgi:hypothetical protein
MSDTLQSYSVVLALALVTSTTAVTITKARAFREVRAWIAQWGPWWRDLFHCPYCLSHWIALGLVLVYRPAVVHSGLRIVDGLMSLLVIVALAAVWSRLLCGALQTMDGPVEQGPPNAS